MIGSAALKQKKAGIRTEWATTAKAARVVNATVIITGTGGQGVLVSGGFILTAAHCIRWNGEGGMVLGDYFIENVTTKSGSSLRLGTIAADPISDIAVLGALDNQEFGKDCDHFEKWCAATQAVPLATTTPHVGRSVRIHTLTHKGEWIRGRISRISFSPLPICGSLCLESDDRIEGGTSGGPVVDSNGRLVGVVSNVNDVADGEKCYGNLPIVHLALPRWTLRLILAAARRKADI